MGVIVVVVVKRHKKTQRQRVFEVVLMVDVVRIIALLPHNANERTNRAVGESTLCLDVLREHKATANACR